MTPQPEPRIGDAERAAAADALGEHYAAGRLTREEYDERSERVWAAKTDSDLRPLFVDLPAPGGVHPSTWSRPTTGQSQRQAQGRQGPGWACGPVATGSPGPGAGRSRRGPHVPWVPVILLVIGLSFLVPGPWWLILVGAAVFTCSRGMRHTGSHHHPRRT